MLFWRKGSSPLIGMLVEYFFLKLLQIFKIVVKSTERVNNPFQIMVQIMIKSSNIEILSIKWIFIGFVLLEVISTVLFVSYMRNYMWKKHKRRSGDNLAWSFLHNVTIKYIYNCFLAFPLVLFNSYLLLNIYIFVFIMYYCTSVMTIIGCPLIIVVLLYIYLNIFIIKQKTLRSTGCLFGDFELDWLEFPFLFSNIRGYFIFYPAYKCISLIYYIINFDNEYEILLKDVGLGNCYFCAIPQQLKTNL